MGEQEADESTTQAIVRLLGAGGCLNCHAAVATTADGHVSGIKPVYSQSDARGAHVQCIACGQLMALSADRKRVLKILRSG